MSERYRTYTLRIMRAEGVMLEGLNRHEIEDIDRAVSDAEARVDDALPSGWYCKIDESGVGVDLAAVRRLEEIAEGGA